MLTLDVLPSASNNYLSLTFVASDYAQGGKTNTHQLCRFAVAYITLLQDSPLNSSHGPKPRNLVRGFARSIDNFVGLIETIKAYSLLGDKFVNSTSSSALGSRQAYLGTEFKETPIFKEYLTYYRTGDTEVFRFILSFLWFGKKMDYENPVFNRDALRAWVEVEKDLSELVLTDDVGELAAIVKRVLPQLATTRPYPKFGPGHVSERDIPVTRLDKALRLDYDSKIDRAFFRQTVFLPEGVTTPSMIIPSYDRWDPEISSSTRDSRRKFVPKNYKVARTIGMEPNIYMYGQQAVAFWMEDAIGRSPLRRFIDLRDQSRNRDLARSGSLYNDIDTIDLSAASDRVSVDLVKKIFPREWLYFMLATRTSLVKGEKGEVTRVRKFAPMGSALCFPTQCIIFSCISLQAALYYLRATSRGFSWQPLDAQIDEAISLFADQHGTAAGFKPLAVFGDDICVDSRLTWYVTCLLQRYGFQVNTDKSFTGDDSFRESCGGFYLGGEDVTPIYYRVKRCGNLISAKNFANLTGLVNSTPKNFRNYRKFLIRVCTSLNPSIAFSTVPLEGTILCEDNGSGKRNHHLKSRWNADLQYYEVRARTVGTRMERFPEGTSEHAVMDAYLYLQWMRSTLRGEDEPTWLDTLYPNGGSSRGDAANLCMVWRWIPDHTI